MRSSLAFLLLLPTITLADDWPQWLGPKRDGVWRETGIAEKLNPKEVWRKPIGAGYAGPAIAAGKVYVHDRVLGKGAANPQNPFDTKTTVGGSERVLCLNEKTGETLWKHEYPCTYKVSYGAGPRCTPTVDGDRVYTLGTMGDLYCLDVANGKVIWEKHFIKDYESVTPIWGFAAHPLVDGDKLICLVGGSEQRMVVAFDKKTGKELWASQTTNGDFGYCPPMIYQIGSVRQLIIWHPAAVVGLDPETGKRLWSTPFTIKAALTAPTPRMFDKDHLFVTAFYDGPMMLKLNADKPGAEIAWKGKSSSEQPTRTDGLHSIMSTPFIHEGHIYGVCSYGELRCLDAKTGKRIWMSMQATRPAPSKDSGAKKLPDEPVQDDRWANAFLIPNGDRWFLFNERGELIIAKLSPKGYEEIDRKKVIEPTNRMARHPVVWMHPAFANQNIYVRNDVEIVCWSLAK